ncbi:hypothetical protein LG288_02875 [Idiomarina seosinensis]|uniref:hypothetical protein n=1 Tax=Idiomarina seosinensis TaxID=281739 RepID=UPI00384B8DB0
MKRHTINNALLSLAYLVTHQCQVNSLNDVERAVWSLARDIVKHHKYPRTHSEKLDLCVQLACLINVKDKRGFSTAQPLNIDELDFIREVMSDGY